MDWELLPVKEFNKWSDQWQSLNRNLAEDLPILDPIFISTLINCFADGNELLSIGKSNEQVVAMGIFHQNSPTSWQTFQPSQAPVGIWLCSQESLLEALESLIKKLPGLVLKIDILHQDPDIYPPLLAAPNIEVVDYIHTSKLPIDQDFDSYFATLGKNQRQNYNKANNRLKKQSTIIKLEIVTDTQEMHQSVEQYGEIESNSWKDSLGTSININNQQGQFYSQLLSEFAKTKNAQVWKYFYDEQLVAVDLCIKNDKQLIILKTTFDSKFSRYSPAINMKLDAFKPLFNDRFIQHIEFFGKTLDWHKRLNSTGRKMYHFSFYRYSILLELKKLFIGLNNLIRFKKC